MKRRLGAWALSFSLLAMTLFLQPSLPQGDAEDFGVARWVGHRL